MKSLCESRESFAAYATIDAGYYMIKLLMEKMDKEMPKDGLSRMIDDATGYGTERYLRYCKESIIILDDMIKAKKFIEADYSVESEMLLNVKAIYKRLNKSITP